jgi:hypothetical protein
MAYTLWYFAIDAENRAVPLAAAVADRVNNGDIPDAVPLWDTCGVLLATVAVLMENRVPVEIGRVWLAAIPTSKAEHGYPVPPVNPAIAQGIRDAIETKLRRQKVRRLGVSAAKPCADLETRIRAGEMKGFVYADSLGMARQQIYGPPNRHLRED